MAIDPGTILSGIGALGGLFGASGAQRDANRLRQRELQLQERALGNYEKYAGIAQGYRDQGTPYLDRQGQSYRNLGQIGSTERQQSNNLLAQLYPQFAQVSGVQGIQFPQAQTTSNLSPNFNRTAGGAQGASAADVLNNRNAFAQQQQANQAISQANQPMTSEQVYGLTQPQQEQLNQRVDTIRRQEAMAIEEYRAALMQQGLPPNPAGEARIRESLSGMVQQEQSQFAESARQERSKALMSLIGFALGDKAAGTDLMQQEAGGYGNVAQGYNSYAQSALGQGESGPYAQMAAQLGQQSAMQTQRADDFMQTLGQFLPLIAEAFKKKPKTTTTTTGNT